MRLVLELRSMSPESRQAGRSPTYNQVRNEAILGGLLLGYNFVSAVVRLGASVPEARQAAWIRN